jgi:hypothetical protein
LPPKQEEFAEEIAKFAINEKKKSNCNYFSE